jgi:hypothetical protein
MFERFADHDYDLDADVDHEDWDVFCGCWSGPDSATPTGPCASQNFFRSDADDDQDVDMADVAAFQQACNAP